MTRTRPEPTRGGGWFYRKTSVQRRITREIASVLQDDLYRRWGGGGSEDEPAEPCFATWVSPLKWSVDYGCNLDGETMWIRVYGPDHKLFAASFGADRRLRRRGVDPVTSQLAALAFLAVVLSGPFFFLVVIPTALYFNFTEAC